MLYWENESDEELFENLLSALDDYGQEAANLYKQRLMSDGKVASGKLVQSIKPLVAYSAQGLEYTVFFEMEDYWKYVEAGLKGRGRSSKNSSSPFRAAEWNRIFPFILKWVREKRLGGRAKDGKLPTEKALAAMISRTISEEGISKGGQLEETVRAVNAYQLPKLQEALERDWEAVSYKIYDGLNKYLKV